MKQNVRERKLACYVAEFDSSVRKSQPLTLAAHSPLEKRDRRC